MKLLRKPSFKSSKSVASRDTEAGSVQSDQKRESRSFKRFTPKRLSSRSRSKSKQRTKDAPLSDEASQSLENEDDGSPMAPKADAIAEEPVKEEEAKVDTKAEAKEEAKVEDELKEDAGKEAEQETTAAAPVSDTLPLDDQPDDAVLIKTSIKEEASMDEEASATKPAVEEEEETSAKSDVGEVVEAEEDKGEKEEDATPLEKDVQQDTAPKVAETEAPSEDNVQEDIAPKVSEPEATPKEDLQEDIAPKVAEPESDDNADALVDEVIAQASDDRSGTHSTKSRKSLKFSAKKLIQRGKRDVQQDTAPKVAETEAPSEDNVQEDIAPKVSEPEATPEEDVQEDIAPKVAEPESDDNADALVDEVIAQASDDRSGTHSTKSRKSLKFSAKKLIQRGKRSLRNLKHSSHDEQSNPDEEKTKEASDEELDATSPKETVQADANASEDVVADNEMEEVTSPKVEEEESAPMEEDGVAPAIEEKKEEAVSEEKDAASTTEKENAAPANDETNKENASPEKEGFPTTNVPEEEVDFDDEISKEPSIEAVEREGDVVLGYYQPTAQENEEAADEGFFASLSVMVEGLMNCGNIANVVCQPEEGVSDEAREDRPAEEAESPPLASEDDGLTEGHSTKDSKSLDDKDTEQEQLTAADDSCDQVVSRVEEPDSENAEAMVDTAESKKQLGVRLDQDGGEVHSNMQLSAGEDCRNDSNEVDPALNTEELRQEVRC